jgi:transposase InsO family protein
LGWRPPPHAILVRCRISRLAHLDRSTGQPVRRYEHDQPGSLVHVDVKKLGNIPAGGGHRFLGRAAGGRNSQADRSSGRVSRHRNPLIGHGFIHVAVDDHSRLAYAEIYPDEASGTAASFFGRAHAWFHARGVVVQRVLTDNGGCYRSHRWRQTCQQLGVTPKRTRPYRPQSNGKVERFNRTLVEGWAYRRPYPTERARRAAFGPWLHWYNHHRPTARSEVVHRSPAAPTSPSLTARPSAIQRSGRAYYVRPSGPRAAVWVSAHLPQTPRGCTRPIPRHDGRLTTARCSIAH